MAVKDGGRHSRTMIIHKMEGLSIKKSISKRLKYKVEHNTNTLVHTFTRSDQVGIKYSDPC